LINMSAWLPDLSSEKQEATIEHKPVMLEEVIKGLNPGPGKVYIDGTVGLGGHSAALLRCFPQIKLLIGCDLDPYALEQAASKLAPFQKKVRLIHTNYIEIPHILEKESIGPVDGILLDLGLSSFQLESPSRGFSFRRDEPLDMRMNPNTKVSAADMVNNLPVAQLIELLKNYGQERWASRIAYAIDRERKKRPILSTKELADLVFKAIPRKRHPRRIHPATKTFQALRIAVNKELDNLSEALRTLPDCLKPSGKLVIISFHSLEDRLVKHAIRNDSRLTPLTKKPITPSTIEIDQNPRARSAKLRIAERVEDANEGGTHEH